MEECADMEVDPGLLEPEHYAWMSETEQKWRILRKAVHPEPGNPKDDDRSYQVPTECRLATKFKDSGLQVIVKMASIELTPDKPVFPAGNWHVSFTSFTVHLPTRKGRGALLFLTIHAGRAQVEGQMNEYICATALYYLDSENITPSHLAFRMPTDRDDVQENTPYEQGEFDWHEQVYGTHVGDGFDAPCLQNYGSVETKQGRLLAFPNVL